MKKILKALLALIVVLVVLLLAHPLWIGPVVRTAVSQLAPKFLGVPAHLDGFAFNAYTGRLTVDGFVLDNPPGCPEMKFVTVGHLCLDVDPLSVVSDPIVVEEVSVRDLYVSIMSDDRKVYNFTTISENVSSASPKAEKDAPKPPEPAEKDGKPEPKVIIDLLQVQNALVRWERLSLPLPSFRLTGIGRQAGGVEFEAAWKEIETQFVGALGPLAKGLMAVLDQGQGQLGAGLKAATDITKATDLATQSLKDVSKAMKDGSPESVDAAVKSVNEAAKSIEGSVKQFKSLFK